MGCDRLREEQTMVVSTRIVLSLLGVLGAIQAGLSLNLEDRYPASYAYPAFAVVVFLVFAVFRFLVNAEEAVELEDGTGNAEPE